MSLSAEIQRNLYHARRFAYHIRNMPTTTTLPQQELQTLLQTAQTHRNNLQKGQQDLQDCIDRNDKLVIKAGIREIQELIRILKCEETNLQELMVWLEGVSARNGGVRE